MNKLGLAAVTVVFSLFIFANNSFAAESVPGEFLVKIKPVKGTKTSVLNVEMLLGAQVKSRFQGDRNLFVVKKEGPQTAALESFLSNGVVEFAEPNYIYRIDSTPNDADYNKSWSLHGTTGFDINAEKAWDISTGSKDIVIAVVDTGIDLRHSDLKDNLWTNVKELNGKKGVDDDGNGFIDDIHGYNFYSKNGNPQDGHGHGSHCSGVIGARGNDGYGIAGVNWKVQLMAVKFLSDEGSGTLEDAVKAIDYAVANGARVLSNSWGGGGYSEALKQAIVRANAKGILFVAAAGNDSADNDGWDHYPSNYDVPNVLAVAATDRNGDLAEFSDYGLKTVHIAAPGVNVFSCFTGNSYDVMSGTSMATPHVAGVAGLILSTGSYDAVTVKKKILNSARPLKSLEGKIMTGGLLDAYKAMIQKD